jgi:hypothetical protein
MPVSVPSGAAFTRFTPFPRDSLKPSAIVEQALWSDANPSVGLVHLPAPDL